jgi:general secretion pathway protein J
MELMVSIVIFAIMSTIAFSGLQTIMNTREQTDKAALQLKNLQTTMTFLRQDIEQTVGRRIRDEFGDQQEALHGDRSSLYTLELTRAGNTNPLNLQRSNLKRVAYKLLDDKFYRVTWKTLDRAQESEPYILELLDNVTNFEIRFLDEKQQWHSSWPPIESSSSTIASLPLAVEVNLTLKEQGEIIRLFQVAGKHSVEEQNI